MKLHLKVQDGKRGKKGERRAALSLGKKERRDKTTGAGRREKTGSRGGKRNCHAHHRDC